MQNYFKRKKNGQKNGQIAKMAIKMIPEIHFPNFESKNAKKRISFMVIKQNQQNNSVIYLDNKKGMSIICLILFNL